MIIFKINSQSLSKNPSTMKAGLTKIQKTDRTMDGTLVTDIIAYKNTLTVTWDFLRDADLRSLVSELKIRAFCTIEYQDPQSSDIKNLRTMTAQAGDLSYQAHYDYGLDEIVWKSVSITFTEC